MHPAFQILIMLGWKLLPKIYHQIKVIRDVGYDDDMAKLYKDNGNWKVSEFKTCKAGVCDIPASHPDTTCKDCEPLPEWLIETYQNPKGLLDINEPEDIIEWMRLPKYIWCEGHPLEVGKKADLDDFNEIKDQALLKGVYNSKLLEEGGLDQLYKDWYQLMGVSDYRADSLVRQGMKPWEFQWM